MTEEKDPGESLAQLKAQLDEAEQRAQSAETMLDKAKAELLTFSTSDDKDKLAEKLDEMQGQNKEMTLALRKLLKDLEKLQREASHWRGRFLLSEIDVVSASDRAEKAEAKLSEAVKPVPYDEQQLILEREMSWMAFVDPITGLGNANRLDLQLQQLVPKSLTEGKILALFILDLDKFRQLTEFAGWEQANMVLKTLARRLEDNIPKSTLFVRRAEDDFAFTVILDGPGQGGMGESPLVRCRQIADFLLQLFQTPFEVKHQKYPLSASIGISICPDDADSPAELLANAYAALSKAKERGCSQYVIYSDKVYQEKESRANLAAELKEALGSDRLLFLFRPVADVQKGNLTSAVVEPYWEHASHGRVDLDTFMPLAQEHGLMPAVVRQMIGAACELSRKMKGSIQIMVRCPAAVLQLSGFAKHTMDAISAARINPKSICIELPGESLHTSRKEASTLFGELSRWGLGCAASFGEGSSIDLQALVDCHVNLISLTPGLMESVPAQEARRSVIQAYLDMSNRLAIPSLVQGVVDGSQSHFLALHNAARATGDFLSPPLKLGDFVSRRRTTWQFK